MTHTSPITATSSVPPPPDPSANGADPAAPAVEASPDAGLVAAGFAALFAVPFAVAAVALAHPRWFPLLDLAQTEIRIRDVGTSDPPLIGLPGRIGTLDRQGSHPGPLSFWALWPFYRLFGGSAWAATAGAASLHVIAVGTMLWIAKRRGGATAVIGLAVVLAVLLRFYGPSTLSQAWNPYMPLLWWLVFVLALWSVLCGDRPMLLVTVFAGTFIMQTHISYLGLVGGLTGLALAVGLAGLVLRRRQRGIEPPAERPSGRVPWVALAVALAAVLWTPPVIQQFTSSPGNLSILWDHFTEPPETPIGLRAGVDLVLVHLNPWRLVARQDATTGAIAPGLILLALWSASVFGAWRLRHRALLRLDLLLGVALLLGVSSAARIFGYVWYYLVLWAWGIAALMALAIGWTLALALAHRWPRVGLPRTVRLADAALAGIAVITLASFTYDTAYADHPAAPVSASLGRLVAPTVEALDSGTAPGDGRSGRYFITWADPINIGSQAYGLLLELERQGFDVGLTDTYRAIVTPRRVVDAEDATAEIHLAVGNDIDVWAAKPGVERVAYDDPRTPAERAEYQRLRGQVIDELRSAGLTDLIPNVDGSVFTATYEPRVPRPLQERLKRMLALGLPTAVFVGPPNADG